MTLLTKWQGILHRNDIDYHLTTWVVKKLSLFLGEPSVFFLATNEYIPISQWKTFKKRRQISTYSVIHLTPFITLASFSLFLSFQLLNSIKPIIHFTFNYFFLFAKPKIAPKAMERKAAMTTLYSGGNINVMVCAGIQKIGMVLKRTNET